ncbi:acyltransferase [Paenibacillus marinisediminis]
MGTQDGGRRMSKPRIDEITVLRALAFFAIVLQHSIGEYIYREDILVQDSIMLGMLYHFTRYGTLTFVFLSTVILFYNYDSTVAYRPFLKRRAQAVLVPYVVWTLIYGLCSLNTELLTADGWIKLLRQFIDPTYGYHMWFILMIFQLYLVFPLLARWVERCHAWAKRRFGEDLRKPLIVLMIGLGGLYALLMDWSYRLAPHLYEHLNPVGKGLLSHRTMFVGMYFFYIAMGIVCSLYLKEWRQGVKKFAGWSLAVFVVGYIYIGYRLLEGGVEPINLNISTYLKPSLFIVITAQMLFMYAAALYILEQGGWLARTLQKIGTYSFGGYLVHALVLSFFAFWTRGIPLEGYHLLAAVLTWIVVASISICISWALDKLPFGIWLTGPMGRKKTVKPDAAVNASGVAS